MPGDQVAYKGGDNKIARRSSAKQVDAQHDGGDGDVEGRSKDGDHAQRGGKGGVEAHCLAKHAAHGRANAEQRRDLAALVARAQRERRVDELGEWVYGRASAFERGGDHPFGKAAVSPSVKDGVGAQQHKRSHERCDEVVAKAICVEALDGADGKGEESGGETKCDGGEHHQ